MYPKSIYFGPMTVYRDYSKVPIWVVVKIMVPFGVLTMIRHLMFRAPKKGP